MTIEQYKQALRLRHKALRKSIRHEMMFDADIDIAKDVRALEIKLLRAIARLNGWLAEIEE